MKTIFFDLPAKYVLEGVLQEVDVDDVWRSMWMNWSSSVIVIVSPSSAGAVSVSAWGRLTPMPDCISGRRDHEDDEQDEHDVDERRDVDLGEGGADLRAWSGPRAA